MDVDADAGDVVVERPVLAVGLVVVVATVAYVGVQVALGGAVDAVETGLFVGVFTLVYVGGKRLLARQGDPE